MANKFICRYFLLSLFLFFFQTSFCNEKSPLLEFKGGYFFFQNTTLDKIYHRGGADFQLSTRFPLYKDQKFRLDGYASLEFLFAKGESLGDGEKTTFAEVPLSLGLGPTLFLSSVAQCYLTLGPRYFYVMQWNDSSFVDRKNHDHVFGGFVNTGFYFFPYSRLTLNIFGEYSYGVGSFSSHLPNVFKQSKNIGGFTFGLGIGWEF